MSSVALPLSPTRLSRRSSTTTQQRVPARTNLNDRIMNVMSSCTDRTGMSLVALKRSLKDGGYNVDTNKTKIRGAIKRMLDNDSLVQTKGAGASGSFKINSNPSTSAGRNRASKKNRQAKSSRKATNRARSARSSSSDRSPDRGNTASRRSKRPVSSRRATSAKRARTSTRPTTSRRATTSKRPTTSRRATTSKRPAAAKKPKSRAKANVPTRSRTRSTAKK